MYSLGVDMAQDKFDVCLFDQKNNKDIIQSSFANDPNGFEACKNALLAKDIKLKKLNIYLESTGGLEESFFEYFSTIAKQVYILNAKQVHNFKKALFEDHKTDPIDAKGLARMIVLPGLKNSHKTKQDPSFKQLEDYGKQREFLLKQKVKAMQRLNRLRKIKGEKFNPLLLKQLNDLITMLESQIDDIENELYKLIKTDKSLENNFNLIRGINGIGKLTTLTLIEFLGKDGKCFANGEKFCAFAGLYPTLRQSGKWIGQTKLTMKGNRRLRRSLYMCAMCSVTREGKWKRYYIDSLKRGKKPKQVFIAIANKMAKLAWSVIYNQKAFDASIFMPQYA